MTTTMRAVVEISGPDPFGLRQQCEEQCNEWLLGEPEISDVSERQAHADWLLRRFLKTIDQRTAGADGLSVAIDSAPILFHAGDAEAAEIRTGRTVLVEYSLDSLGDIAPAAFEAACISRAESLGLGVEFKVGLNNRETIDGEPSDRIVERAFAACCG